MSLIKVNNIESLNGAQGTINMTGNLVVNGMPISGQQGAQGAAGGDGAQGPQGATPAGGGISGSTVVYVSASADPVANGIALQAGYDAAKLLADSTITQRTWTGTGFGGFYVEGANYGSFLQRALVQLYYDNGSAPVSCTFDTTPAWYTWDGMSFSFSSTIDMMTAFPAGSYEITTDIITYTYSTLIVAPGYYQTPSTFLIDTDFVNITSLSGEPDVFIYSPEGYSMMFDTPSWIYITANNVTITGISTYLDFLDGMNFRNGNGQIEIGGNLTYLVMKNCIGGKRSFGNGYSVYTISLSGTFINCKVYGDYGFGSNACVLQGRYIDCEVYGSYGFGYNGCTLSGSFENCKSSDGSGYGFGYSSGSLPGIFINCYEENNAGFGASSSTLSGTFYNCISGGYGFGSSSVNTGEFYNCVSGDGSFGSSTGAKYYNCVAGAGSWGGSIDNSKLYHCVVRSGMMPGSYATVTNGGRTFYCIDSAGNVNNQ